MFKNKVKFLSCAGIGVASLFLLFGCNNTPGSNSDSSSEISSSSTSSQMPLSTFVYSDYEGVNKIDDVESYYGDTLGEKQFLADTNGIIISPYHTLKVNEISVPVYSARVGCGIHSFCYLINKDSFVNLNVEITTFQDMEKTVVLPLSSGVAATTNGKVTTANLNDFGTFSFAFNDTYTWGLTIIVAENEEFSLPDGYQLVEYEPGNYAGEKSAEGYYTDKEKGSFVLNQENTAYYFKKGRYLIHDIKIGSNVQVYFEPGTYLETYCYYNESGTTNDNAAFMTSSLTNNWKVYGNAVCDFAAYVGGGPNNPLRSAYGFASVNNVIFKGTIGIDNSGWTLCFTNSTNLDISWNLLLSYKECSDGIMLSDCQSSHIHHNFCRVGDDAIEAKSTGALGSKDLIYEYNAVWADKCRCYGCIYEANRDMENITFRYNSVGFSLPNWTDLGCLVIALGNNNTTTWHDVHFEDTEIYYARTQILSMYSEGIGGNIKNIYFKNITCYGPFAEHEELVYVDVVEGSTMGKVYVENFNYKNEAGEMVKYTQDDTKNETLTHISVSHQYSKKNIVVS